MKKIERLVRGFGLLWLSTQSAVEYPVSEIVWLDLTIFATSVLVTSALAIGGLVSLGYYLKEWLKEKGYKTKISTKT